MAKRSATTQLTADNYELEDQDEEKEQKGVFKKASEDELKKREFKRAKRTLPPNGEKGSTNPFSALKLFNTGGAVTLPPPPQNAFVKLVPEPQSTLLQRSPMHKLTPPSQAPSSENNNGSSKYHSKLKDLNVSVSEWISQHVKKNPYIDLTPVFNDYKKYMAEIEEDCEKENEEETEDDKMEAKDDSSSEEEEGESVEEENVPKDIPLQLSTDKGDDDTSLINMRCKLFYKKDTEFVELGLGNVCVTKGEKGGVNVLLRNDTTMRKVLLNVHLSKGVPLSLTKNKLLMVCMPNPPLETPGDGNNKPVTYLIKVKDEYAAKNLHTTINNHL